MQIIVDFSKPMPVNTFDKFEYPGIKTEYGPDEIPHVSPTMPNGGMYTLCVGAASVDVPFDATQEDVQACADTLMELNEGMRKIERAFDL